MALETTLIAKYSAYPEYKDSGVEWLDVIPCDWVVSKIKYLAPFQVGWTPSTKVDANFIGDNLWANISDLRGKYLDHTAKNISDEAAKAASMEISPKGSLLYSFKLSVGSVSFASKDMYTNEAIASFLKGGSLPLSYMYYALPKFVIENASTNIYGARILNQELINNAYMLAPSYQEADKISNFLDHETAKIDTLIDKQQQLIKLLKEKRQAVISHAVTRGLNPSAPMRDSGVECLGEVPEHWCEYPLKALFSLKQGYAFDGANFSDKGEFILMTPGNFNERGGYKYKRPEKFYVGTDIPEGFILKGGQMLVAMTEQTPGLLGCALFVPNEGTYLHNQRLGLVQNLRKDKVSVKYLFHFFNSSRYRAQVSVTSTGAKVKHTSSEKILTIKICLPPVSEQEDIANFVDETMNKIEVLEEKAAQIMLLLQERRTALISAAVTGKIDVRNWHAHK